eukprot:g6494.t1
MSPLHTSRTPVHKSASSRWKKAIQHAQGQGNSLARFKRNAREKSQSRSRSPSSARSASTASGSAGGGPSARHSGGNSASSQSLTADLKAEKLGGVELEFEGGSSGGVSVGVSGGAGGAGGSTGAGEELVNRQKVDSEVEMEL